MSSQEWARTRPGPGESTAHNSETPGPPACTLVVAMSLPLLLLLLLLASTSSIAAALIPASQCRPSAGMTQLACSTLIRRCWADHKIHLQWVGRGCRDARGRSANDGGKQGFRPALTRGRWVDLRHFLLKVAAAARLPTAVSPASTDATRRAGSRGASACPPTGSLRNLS